MSQIFASYHSIPRISAILHERRDRDQVGASFFLRFFRVVVCTLCAFHCVLATRHSTFPNPSRLRHEHKPVPRVFRLEALLMNMMYSYESVSFRRMVPRRIEIIRFLLRRFAENGVSWVHGNAILRKHFPW